MNNSFGEIFRLTSFGESHGLAIGGVIDGFPAGVKIDFDQINYELKRRKPGVNKLVSPRKEDDRVEFLSGIFEGTSTGTPISFLIKNENQNSEDYDKLRNVYRPSHADFVYQKKYNIRDYRGGGRSSARTTASIVVAGSLAKQILKTKGIEISAWTSGIGEIEIPETGMIFTLEDIENSLVRCPLPEFSEKMKLAIEKAKSEEDSLGGIVTCRVSNDIIGLGEPLFNKLNAQLAKGIFSINAVKSFEIGSGKSSAKMKGSKYIDEYCAEETIITTKTNNSGGIQGGISNGKDIIFKTAFHPPVSIGKNISMLNSEDKVLQHKVEGRHDPCVVMRAVPIVEAMAAIVMLDFVLLKKSNISDE